MVLSLAAVMALGCGQALHRSDGRARSAAPIRASCVKRAWVISPVAFTVSPGWA